MPYLQKGYPFTGTSPNNTVTAEKLNALVDEATIQPGFSNGATDALGSAVAVPSTYQFLQECFDTNPITTAAWSVSDLATLQKLVKRSA